MNRGIKARKLLGWATFLVALFSIYTLPAFGQLDRGAIDRQGP